MGKIISCPGSCYPVSGRTYGPRKNSSGPLFTGRVGFYRMLFDEGREPPVDIRNTCNVNFHCSPAAGEVAPGEFTFASLTGTASFRFARWIPPLLETYGVKAVIGKGGMQQEVDEVFIPLLSGYPGPTLKRIGETQGDEEVIL